MNDYVIKSGDTLGQIAAKNNTTVSALTSANNIADPNRIAAGATIKIPTNVNNFSDLTKNNATIGQIAPAPTPVPSTQGVLDYATLVNNQFNQQQIDSQQQQAQTNYNDIISQYKSNLQAQENKAADQAALEQQQGLQGMRTQAKDLTDQILANKTQAQVQQLQKGKLGGLTTMSAGNIDAQIEKETAVKNLTLGSQLAAVQGNLALAQDYVDRAITAKYAPLEAKNATLEKLLTINGDILNKADSKALAAQQARLAAAQKDLEEKKSQDKERLTMITNASAQGAPSALVAKAQQAKTPEEAAAVLGMYAGDYWGTKAKIAAYNKTIAETAKVNAEAGKARAETSAANNAVISAAAQSWVDNINSGKAKLSDVPANLKSQVSIGLASKSPAISPSNDPKIVALKNKLDDINGILGNDYLPTISGRIQTSYLNPFTGGKEDLLAKVQNILDTGVLDNLVNAKANGATFGALSDSELNLLKNSSSQLQSLAILDKDGKVTGFRGSEQAVKDALTRLQTSAQTAYNAATVNSPVLNQVNSAVQILNNPLPATTAGYTFSK